MARKRAVDGLQDLIDRTAGPRVVARVKVDQIYAKYQHESLDLRHSSGQAKYLEAPLFENAGQIVQKFANRVLVRGTNTAVEWGKHVGQPVHGYVKRFAPKMFGDLSQSASLTVKEGSAVVYSIPATQQRLTKVQLRAKDKLRGRHE